MRSAFSDSLDLDDALRSDHPREHRWDYLLGHGSSRRVIGIEPHSAKDDEVDTVIAKKKAALAQMRKHLRSGAVIAAWIWVSSKNDRFADTEVIRRRLDHHGIRFVGKRVLGKHLE